MSVEPVKYLTESLFKKSLYFGLNTYLNLCSSVVSTFSNSRLGLDKFLRVAVLNQLKVYAPVALTPQSSKETQEDHLLKTNTRRLLTVSKQLIEAIVLGTGVDIIVQNRDFGMLPVE